jgi:hypothetical protein
MSLVKNTVLDKVEFVENSRVLQERQRTDVLEDGVIISSSYSRNIYEIQPIENLPENLQPYVTGVWTDEMIEEVEAQKLKDAQDAQDALDKEETE